MIPGRALLSAILLALASVAQANPGAGIIALSDQGAVLGVGEIAVPPAGAGAAVQDSDAVLGTLELSDKVLFWFERDLGLSADSIERLVRSGAGRKREIVPMLRELKAGWVVLRDPAGDLPYAAFFDPGPGKVFYVDVSSTADLGGGPAGLAGLSREGDRLIATYGSPKSSTMARQRLEPERGGAFATIELARFSGGRLASGWVREPALLDDLLSQPGLKEWWSALRPASGEGPSPRERMAGFLAEGADRIVTVSPVGAAGYYIKLRAGDRDAFYFYAAGGALKGYSAR